MDSDSADPGSLDSLIQTALNSALASEAGAPLLAAGEILLTALAEHPNVAALLDAESIEGLLAALEAAVPEFGGLQELRRVFRPTE